MTADKRYIRHAAWAFALVMLLITATGAWAQTNTTPPASTPAATTTPPPATTPAQASKTSMEIYGFAMLDIGHNFGSIHPNWFDTMRVVKLPKFEEEYGKEGNAFAGVRQSRFGVKTSTPTDAGELKTQFEFEMFGVGVDEGQTTIRLRHAYGELGRVGAGQTWSVFMDPDVFPNSAEYWGPTGMVFFRNVQARFYVLKEDKQSLILALEKPGASGDPGTLADRVEIQNIKGRSPMLDFTGAYTRNIKMGYVRAAGVIRKIAWDDLLDDQFDLSGDAVGWGLNFSSNLKFKDRTTLRLQFMFGEGVQNYMNDSPIDVGIESNPGNATSPIKGVPLPITAWVAMVDHTINSKWSTTFGYSRQDIDNSEGQAPDAFNIGDYFIANIGHYPAPNVMILGEYQWGQRTNFSDGWKYDASKIQFSFKYNFSWKLGG